MPVFAQELPADSVLRRLAANMLMVGFKGDSVEKGDEAYRYVHDLGVGAIVLFDIDLTGDATIGSRNITSVAQMQDLTSKLKSWSQSPLLIALDQEGGRVARLKPQYGYHPTVTSEYLGDLSDEDTTRMYAKTIAEDIAMSGVNVNLAPVVDVLNDSCPVIAGTHRAYSRDLQKVSDNASWFVDEHRKAGVLCVLKHFPGHGSSRGDTHYGLVDVTNTWDANELIPFIRLIDNGKADMIMTAHIYNGNIDKDYPATLSKKTIQQVLRDQLGFDGVVVTDDLYMQGVISTFGIEEAIILAINAGADMICAGNNGYNSTYEADRPAKMIDIIVEAIKNHRIPMSRIYESNQRINDLKQKIASN